MIKINQTKIFETYQEFIKYENQFKSVPDIALTLKQLKHEMKGITSSSRQKRGLINFLGTAHKYLLTEDDKKFIFTDQCISQILTNQFAKFQHTFVSENESVKYIEPNIIITYNLKETQINQDCEMFNKTIQGNNIIQLSQCTLEIRNK